MHNFSYDNSLQHILWNQKNENTKEICLKIKLANYLSQSSIRQGTEILRTKFKSS